MTGRSLSERIDATKNFIFKDGSKPGSTGLERISTSLDGIPILTFSSFTMRKAMRLKGWHTPDGKPATIAIARFLKESISEHQILYVFGRYPRDPDGDKYPVFDLVICHGDFLNADNAYVHKNSSFCGFGNYGDILVRDRKMYVAPTPFALVEGMAHHRTLILPKNMPAGPGLCEIAILVRREAERIIVAYDFDLQTNELNTITATNPNANQEHTFVAYRVDGDPMEPVTMRE